jgi:two-component system, chemotaxis family, CheB/CheR fusion protein
MHLEPGPHPTPIPGRDLTTVVAIACVTDPASASECAAVLGSVPPGANQSFVVVGGEPAGVASSGLRLCAARDGEQLAPGHAYIAPPDSTVLLDGDRLVVTTTSVPPRPVDRLLRSMVASRGGRSRAVMLAGATDGLLGLRDLRLAGGLCFSTVPVFDPLEGGPAVDLTVAPDRIAATLAEVDRRDPIDLGTDIVERLAGLYVVLRHATGTDFSRTRVASVMAKVLRRMVLVGESSLGAYIDRLDDDPPEVDALYRDLTRKRGGFFRESDLVEQVNAVIAARVEEESDEPVRFWVVGCGTGEVAYSIAMAAAEARESSGRDLPIKILATDSDERLLDRARAAWYPAAIDLDVSPERLAHFFGTNERTHQVAGNIRDMCTFGRHDPLQDPPFSRLDLVWCRGTLEHLDPIAVGRILPRLHYGLRPGGHALFGTSDPVDDGLFEVIRPGIYRRRFVPTGSWANRMAAADAAHSPPHQQGPREPVGRGLRFDVQREAERTLLERFSPPAVVVDDANGILGFHGSVAPWLSPQPGHAVLDLERMVRPDLLAEIRRLLEEARAEGHSASGEPIPVVDLEGSASVRIHVSPIAVHGLSCWIVAFEDHTVAPGPRVGEAQLWADRVAQLEREVEELRGGLGSMLVQREEELDTAHEEMQSLGEEFQTTHADLVHAKRELETVNEVLRQRNHALASVNVELEGLLGALEIPIVTLGTDLRVLRMTSTAAEVFRTRSTDVGRPIGQLRHTLEIDLEAIAREVIATATSAARDVRDRNGRWWSVSVRPLAQGSGVAGVVVAAFDVDALRRGLEQTDAARRSAEALVEAMGRPLVVVDADLRIRRSNQAFAELVGAPQDEVLGARLPEVPWGTHAELGDALGAVAGAEGWCELEIDASWDQVPRFLQISASSVAWPDLSVERPRLLAIEDVTERRRELERAHALATERAARQAAEAGSRAKDEYLAMLAHELRNPLAPLQTALELMRKSDAPAGWALGVAQRQVRHLSRLVHDLLDASRLARNKIVPRMRPVDLVQLVEQAVESLRPSFERAEIALELSLPSSRPWLLADPVRIDQVLVNLLTNALKYSPSQSTVTVTVADRIDEACISVADEGYGIHPELLPKIFDLFVQAEQRIDRARGGLGIGLTIVKQLVEMHGGSVSAHSEGSGRGAKFVVSLPSHPPPDHDHTEEEASSTVTRRKVLVVDDNRDAADAIALLLGDAGHEVRVVYDGRAALEAVENEMPEVVLLDLGLPGMDGFEVAAELRRRGADLTLIALTGYGDEAHRQRTLEVGFDQHLVKPMEPDVMERLMTDPARPIGSSDT